jgi:hypothetical protein
MFKERSYREQDYLNYEELNMLVDEVTELLEIYKVKVDDLQQEKMNKFELNGYPYVQWISALENNIKEIADKYYKPDGYIENRDWQTKENAMVYQSFSYIDINRMITDVLLLYKIKDSKDTIWNGQSFIEWEKTSDIEWEEY